jgi:hypothetical protein
MKFRKYEFNSQNEWDALKKTLKNNLGAIDTCAIVELGTILLTPGVYDTKNNRIVELVSPVRSTKYAVDILWHNDTIPTSFTQYEVWPKEIGNHTFWGAEDLYKQDYDKRK